MSELDMFTKNHDMVDVWRAQHPGFSVFTWHRPDGTDASRLDRVYSPSYLDQKLHGARVRARVHCVEAEEKPTIKFYRDVTKYAIDRRIRAVRDVHGTLQKDPLDIVEVFKTFYEQLYTRADVEVDLQGSLLDNIDKTPSKEQNDGLGSPPAMQYKCSPDTYLCFGLHKDGLMERPMLYCV
ncbi:hypothetical protein HOLleu_41419 [Holothuria leucospilota]|uniref:Uncharacterized protein n=1 Tax=Holothuria leucospilota TaxID=206669 RepID=A0A9Q0YFW6_HOLLE|nr:hypothetical protein HOLleu_41419 [Holothuria leucospilota]